MLQESGLALFTRVRRLIVDVALSAFSFVTVVVLFTFKVSHVPSAHPIWVDVSLYLLSALFSFLLIGAHRAIWSYVGFRDLLMLVATTLLTTVVFALVELFVFPAVISLRATVLIWTTLLIWAASTIFLAVPRLIARLLAEAQGGNSNSDLDAQTAPILMTGDVTRIEAFIRETRRTRNARHQVVGILSSDPHIHGSYLQGVKILGSIDDLPAIMLRLNGGYPRPAMLVLAKDDAGREDFERVVDVGTKARLQVAKLAAVGSFSSGTEVEPIELSDLLGRPEVKIDLEAVASMVRNKCILVTGGGGSIGGELCRQIARLKPKTLVVVDFSEFNLYSIDQELATDHPLLDREAALADVRDADVVHHLIERVRPDAVFHAAALKHVPLMESNPIEAVKTNVLGTINVADGCAKYGVPAMVTISTDKAVNPCNVMGTTKRLAEAYCQGLDQSHVRSATRFVTVRFGNVLGSTGSVVPLFKSQIEKGGPVTVTHPDVVRYFMTIPEAVSLVLEAGAKGLHADCERGSIYVLQMGKPVKIVDLARRMIKLCGFRPEIDIAIRYVGLRPGEKLYEEVAYGDEAVEPAESNSILKLRPRATDLKIIEHQIRELRSACRRQDVGRLLHILQTSVPEYEPALRDSPMKTAAEN